MERRVQYKGYVIDASPHQLADNRRWSMDITIERHDGASVTTCPFSASRTFETKEEAIRLCINFGRQIIDGQVAGCVAP